MIYMYVLDSSVLQQGVSDALFEKQWEIYQSRVNGLSVGPVPYKTVFHHWEEISALSAAESAEQVESELEVIASCQSEPVVEAADVEAFVSDLSNYDQSLPIDESAAAIESSAVEVQEQENAIVDNTVSYNDDLGAGGVHDVSESLAEAKSAEAPEKERYQNDFGFFSVDNTYC